MDWKLTDEGFFLKNPHLYRGWTNYLSNDDYGLMIDHLGAGYGLTLKEPRCTVNHYDFNQPSKGKFLYIKDKDEIWSPSFNPVKASLDLYECLHAPGYTRFKSRKNDVQVTLTLFLPEKGTYEIWDVEIKNHSNEEKDISLTAMTEFLLYPSFGIDPVYYSWFTDAAICDGNSIIVQNRETKENGFFYSPFQPDSYDCSLKVFLGNGSISAPETVLKGKCACSAGGGDPYIGAFQYNIHLKGKQRTKLCFFAGRDSAQIDVIKDNYSNPNKVHKEFNRMKEEWRENLKFDLKIPDNVKKEFRSYVKTFFPYQIHQQSLGMVRNYFRGFRDVAQDAMGMSFFDRDKSEKLILELCAKQLKNGRCLRQWSTCSDFHDERDFRDLPLWLIVAVCHYIQHKGNDIILWEEARFFNQRKKETVLSHMKKALKHSLRYGPNGLLMMGEGDWNDALSGMGKKAESVWLTQFAYYAITLMLECHVHMIYKWGVDLVEERDRLYEAVMKQWNGEWFNRAVSESGKIIGGKERMFLLPQAWFVISKMALRDPIKAELALNHMVERLDHDYGLLLCDPSFEEYDEEIGRLSALAPGVAENFAIYNHATAFASFAFACMGNELMTEKLIKKIMPFGKDWKATKSEPYVLVNYYNGGYYKEKKGQGGIPWLTSTVTWLAMTLLHRDYGMFVEPDDKM